MLTFNSYPKHNICSANICLLDHDWSQRTHMRGEAICFYLHEYVKQAGIARLRAYIPKEMIKQIAEVLPEINARHAIIKRSLKRAAKSGSKIDALKKPRREAA